MPTAVNTILSAFTQDDVRYLLMGGQACVPYGGAESSRDTDLAVLADSANMNNVTSARLSLGATIIAVPPYDISSRPATAAAVASVVHGAATDAIQDEIDVEQRNERRADAAYWAPLRDELETLRHAAARGELSMGWPPEAR